MMEFAHMCRDGHTEIGFNDSETETCPLCEIRDRIFALGVRKIDATGGSVDLELEMSREVAFMMAGSLLQMLDAAGAENYVEAKLRLRNPADQRIVLMTVQRLEGKSPHDKRLEAEAECARLRALLSERSATEPPRPTAASEDQ